MSDGAEKERYIARLKELKWRGESIHDYPVLPKDSVAIGWALQRIEELENYERLRSTQCCDPVIDSQIGAANTRIKELEADLAGERETFTDEHGTTWRPATAWAYAQVCRVRDEAGREIVALRARVAELEGIKTAPKSLLRDVSEPLPDGCYCKPGCCAAPVIMGRQMPCRDQLKASAPKEDLP